MRIHQQPSTDAYMIGMKEAPCHLCGAGTEMVVILSGLRKPECYACHRGQGRLDAWLPRAPGKAARTEEPELNPVSPTGSAT